MSTSTTTSRTPSNFTPEEGRVTLRARPEGPDAVRLEVEDTGIGIRAEDLGRLFVELTRGLPVTSSIVGEDEYRRRPELVRTLNVLPPGCRNKGRDNKRFYWDLTV